MTMGLKSADLYRSLRATAEARAYSIFRAPTFRAESDAGFMATLRIEGW
ncbi:hypothetical protein L1277_002715 [Okibacterium sp. HSC-33S16]|nr:hypothetical protein [Okibacterium sp. HSC-33S16]